MQLGMIGLGRMGAGLSRRLLRDGHTVAVHDVDPAAIDALAVDGAVPIRELSGFVEALEAPRAVWVMVPAGAITQRVIASLADVLEPGDAIIDGGNSYYRDDLDHAAMLGERGIHLVDVGTSGGVHGLERGFSLMIGGDDAVVARLAPVFRTLAPGVDAAPRTPGLTGEPVPGEEGWLHCGPVGAGHFVKMVHNGVEYGLMAAYAEGLNVLRNANIGSREHAQDAETAPLSHPEHYRFDIDTAAVAEVWRRGSVVGSWLLDLTAAALREDPDLAAYSGQVSDSGEGRWTSIAAIEEGVPTPVLTTALYSRFASRDLDDYAQKALSAMRKGFGGHEEKPTGE
ncbi:decarboxylating 6-phosphogluconate dehydrogenase [Demequina sp. SYSU T00039]|uniref:Decarboxylating 6-phosphogluconate dehydrogenase n=1 Tax=Demequina lignilytica TaxID=3051663 RepID=A0AAW7M1D0_9MICO|nr:MULTISPECIES: decarboxylating 6-phosphogluconate dehydrogenase [unclassified Demequina]MDN4477036.1 decarboxylating 6-phosphogluconate dehydrogenase [Demequina sp. SYSU T00039-1]MDN4487209.1 decarboxylating 6-phosphogluconate dehydrogenase [Demequina sp. SYSU T00039]MDN4491796.1 decarboxylating 6-phosphogluconate dehydrogenase [Demequina sp. SYSU T00068]